MIYEKQNMEGGRWLATFTRLLGLVWCNGTVPMPGDVVRVDFAAFEMEEQVVDECLFVPREIGS